jgi:hypothetical protein
MRPFNPPEAGSTELAVPSYLFCCTAVPLYCRYVCDPSARLQHGPDATRLSAESEQVAAWFKEAGTPPDGEHGIHRLQAMRQLCACCGWPCLLAMLAWLPDARMVDQAV